MKGFNYVLLCILDLYLYSINYDSVHDNCGARPFIENILKRSINGKKCILLLHCNMTNKFSCTQNPSCINLDIQQAQLRRDQFRFISHTVELTPSAVLFTKLLIVCQSVLCYMLSCIYAGIFYVLILKYI